MTLRSLSKVFALIFAISLAAFISFYLMQPITEPPNNPPSQEQRLRRIVAQEYKEERGENATVAENEELSESTQFSKSSAASTTKGEEGSRQTEPIQPVPSATYIFHPECKCHRTGLSLRHLRDLYKDHLEQLVPSMLQQRPVDLPRGTFVGDSSCNDHVSSLGSGQNVVAYTYYVGILTASFKDRYTKLIKSLAERISTAYPGWRMRIYTNVTSGQNGFREFCEMYCDVARYGHVDFCDVARLPKGQYQPPYFEPKNLADFSNLKQSFPHGMFWRFMPFGDLTVDKFMPRDLDSYILDREVAAVNQWLVSNKSFHIMRDGPFHAPPMTGNFWAAHNYANLEDMLRLRSRLFSMKYRYIRPIRKRRRVDWGHDRRALIKEAFPMFKRSLLLHASYRCYNWKGWGQPTPFPTRRDGYTWVGYGPTKISAQARLKKQPCPKMCRPENHQDWKYC